MRTPSTLLWLYFSTLCFSKAKDVRSISQSKADLSSGITNSIVQSSSQSFSHSSNSAKSKFEKPKKNKERRNKVKKKKRKELALWIDENQVKHFSGYEMKIFVIYDAKVLPHILDPNFENSLPVIPADVEKVDFTWQGGDGGYHYVFNTSIQNFQNILNPLTVSVGNKGRVPRKPKGFYIHVPCAGNSSGIGTFGVELTIRNKEGVLPGTPLRLKLKKECNKLNPMCDHKCKNGGTCDAGKKCICVDGYMGPYCDTALCFPRCLNGGTCTKPGHCSCLPGFQGRHCEGGICRLKCLNGGKCIQKDTCRCHKGYYGKRCEYSHCIITCVNGGSCQGINKCRCPKGFSGDHCEIANPKVLAVQIKRCAKRCRHGLCSRGDCICSKGYSGRWCRKKYKGKKHNKEKRRKMWV